MSSPICSFSIPRHSPAHLSAVLLEQDSSMGDPISVKVCHALVISYMKWFLRSSLMNSASFSLLNRSGSAASEHRGIDDMSRSPLDALVMFHLRSPAADSCVIDSPSFLSTLLNLKISLVSLLSHILCPRHPPSFSSFSQRCFHHQTGPHCHHCLHHRFPHHTPCPRQISHRQARSP